MKLKPIENNIIYRIKGTEIGIYETENMALEPSNLDRYENDYYTPFITLPNLLKTSSRKVISKLTGRI